MAGPEAAYPAVDLFPRDPEAHRELLSWCQRAFSAADSARNYHFVKWQKWYQMYRSYVRRRKGNWRSSVFVPYAFSIIETITPKLIAQPPGFLANPIGPEDVFAAKNLATLLNLSAVRSEPDFYIELIKNYKSALKYGTGILKTYHAREIRVTSRAEPIYTEVPGAPMPVTDPFTGGVLRDAMGNVVYDSGPPTQQPTGRFKMVPEPFVVYDGPAAAWVDLFDFWVAPEATDIESARYVMHRTYKDMAHVQRLAAQGIYHLPPNMGLNDIADTRDEGWNVRADAIGQSHNTDLTRRPVELLEIHTDDGRLITVANGKAVIRAVLNPFTHGMKPFVRTVDYLQEGEFYGVGEIEAIEGLQDVQNALVNQRLDNVRIALNAMFAVNLDAINDPRELELRPGGVITVGGDRNPNEVIYPIPMQDVTSSAFEETAQVERLIERVSGVTDLTAGLDSSTYNQTATGIDLVQQAGNTKFTLKANQAEIMGLKPLARQWGSLIQQFFDEAKFVRLLGPDGSWVFHQLQPDSIVGAMDFDIESASSIQTETVLREQAMQLIQVVSGLAPQAVPQLIEDLLTAFGKKDLAAYLGPEGQMRGLMMAQMQQALSQGAPAFGQAQPGMAQPGQPQAPPQGQPPAGGVPLPGPGPAPIAVRELLGAGQ